MNIFGSYLKKLRAQAGLSQDKLAEKMGVSKNTIQNWESGKTNIKIKNITKLSRILNVPESEITAELSRSNDSQENNNWPDFLFDDDNGQVNSVISSLHLNHEQQELFGLLYIYHAEYLEEEKYSHSTLENDLKLIPYQFIDKVGSINFLNISDKLQYVLSYVKSDFLIKVLKKDPDKEFDICRLSKDDICDFIDNGLKLFCDMGDWDDDDLLETAIYFNYNMEKAKKILPICCFAIIVETPLHLIMFRKNFLNTVIVVEELGAETKTKMSMKRSHLKTALKNMKKTVIQTILLQNYLILLKSLKKKTKMELQNIILKLLIKGVNCWNGSKKRSNRNEKT